jgi:nitrite reductase/ring-hydroxylating ferredoxin subunit
MTGGPTWFPVALSIDVPSHSPTGTYLHGEPIVLWRDPAGAVHAWADRCPHRGMQLSLGFLREGRLACPYHGWRYDAEGRCTHIPAHPEVVPPRAMSVERLGARESQAIVWAATGDASISAPAAVEQWRPIRSVTARRSASAVQDALASSMPGLDIEGDALPFPGSGLMVHSVAAGKFGLALQPLGPDLTAVHAVHCGDASVRDLIAFSRRLADLRDACESMRFSSRA